MLDPWATRKTLGTRSPAPTDCPLKPKTRKISHPKGFSNRVQLRNPQTIVDLSLIIFIILRRWNVFATERAGVGITEIVDEQEDHIWSTLSLSMGGPAGRRPGACQENQRQRDNCDRPEGRQCTRRDQTIPAYSILHSTCSPDCLLHQHIRFTNRRDGLGRAKAWAVSYPALEPLPEELQITSVLFPMSAGFHAPQQFRTGERYGNSADFADHDAFRSLLVINARRLGH